MVQSFAFTYSHTIIYNDVFSRMGWSVSTKHYHFSCKRCKFVIIENLDYLLHFITIICIYTSVFTNVCYYVFTVYICETQNRVCSNNSKALWWNDKFRVSHSVIYAFSFYMDHLFWPCSMIYEGLLPPFFKFSTWLDEIVIYLLVVYCVSVDICMYICYL